MTDLSHAAQAVLDAYFTHADLLNREVSHEEMLAAAIRALADQVVPRPARFPEGEYRLGIRDAKRDVRAAILAIATELEGQ
jgi:hypothetical protein